MLTRRRWGSLWGGRKRHFGNRNEGEGLLYGIQKVINKALHFSCSALLVELVVNEFYHAFYVKCLHEYIDVVHVNTSFLFLFLFITFFI